MENFVRDKYVMAAKDTRLAARQYWLNSAFLSGYQYLYWDEVHDIPREEPDDDRVRLVINRMATNHRTNMANLMQRQLEFEVRPNGADDASIESAHVAREILYATHKDHNWEGLRERLYATLLKGGTGALSLDWDDERQTIVERVLSISEFLVEPGARDPERARWWIKAQILPPAEVQAMYDMSEPPPADATSGLNPLQEKLLAVHQGVDQVNALTLVLTYYERPNKLTPKGRVITEVNGKTIERIDEWPFPFEDRLNLVVGIETIIENRWYGETQYSHARAPQVALNFAESNLSEHLRDASIARMLVPHSAVRIMDSMNDIPGYMYPYPDGTEKPGWLNPAQLPAWLQQRPEAYMMHIDDIMGVHDVSRGKAPANLESGTAISILAEQDGTPVGRLVKEVAGMFTRYCVMALQLFESETNEEQHSVIDTEAGPLAISWTGSDISGQYDAVVPYEAVIPRSRAALQQVGNTMLEMGLFANIGEFARFTEMPNTRDIVQTMMPDVAKARREHASMARGEPVIPATFDDHTAHIKEHNDFRKTVAYERLGPEGQSDVDLHIKAHETLAAEQMATMVSRAEADPALAEVPNADGAPAPQGAPAPPSTEAPPADTVDPDPVGMIQQMMTEL